jgi:hypothetical protein
MLAVENEDLMNGLRPRRYWQSYPWRQHTDEHQYLARLVGDADSAAWRIGLLASSVIRNHIDFGPNSTQRSIANVSSPRCTSKS